MRRPQQKFIDLDKEVVQVINADEAEIIRQLSVSKEERKLRNFSLGKMKTGMGNGGL